MVQIVSKSLIAANYEVILTKNQLSVTSYGLNNGAVGIVKAILYGKGKGLHDMPDAVDVYFPKYTGPALDINNPKYVPIMPV